MAGEPLVTIAISTWNAGEYLLAAVRSALDQTYRNVEIIIVDDGSTDGSTQPLKRLDDPRVRVLAQDNQGKSSALNRIRTEATGAYIAIQDGDDFSHPDRIRTQVAVMEARPHLAACFTRHDLLLSDLRFASRRLAMDEVDCARLIDLMKIPAIDPTGMYRVSMTSDIDYEPALRIGEGVDYMLRVGEQHPMVVLGDSLYSYRIHVESTSRRSPIATHDFIEIVRHRACERRKIQFDPLPRPVCGAPAQHAFFGHILEATIENTLAGDRQQATRIGVDTLRHAKLGIDGFKPLLVSVMPKFALRRFRPHISRAKLV